MKNVEVLGIGAHPDDVEIGCGGILGMLSSRGLRVGLLHLTRGEHGSRGTAETRAEEARCAAEALNAEHEILDFGDAGLRTGRSEEDRLIQALREARPRVVLAPAPADRHPDHERAHRLVRDCCFYAGLGKRPDPRALKPHRPNLVLYYMLHAHEEPSLIVDIGAAMETKVRALSAYSSQINLPGIAVADVSSETSSHSPSSVPTWVSSKTFGGAILARARHFGAQIGVDYGEPLLALGPISALEVANLFSGD